MIIELLLDALYSVFNLLTSALSIPSLPIEELSVYTDTFYYAICDGYYLLGNYVEIDILVTFLGIIIAVDLGLAIYHFVMWILRKIPMASIS